MKFSILQQDFLPALQAASRSVGIRATLPILSNVLLSGEGAKLKIAATNLEIGVIKELTSAEIENPGEITVPAKTLIEIVSGLGPVKIDLEATGEILSLSANKFKATINGIDSAEFPAIPFSNEKGIVFKKEILLSCADILFASAADEGRPILTGILTESIGGNLNFVATDGFRLANRQVKIEGTTKTNFKALIPRRTFEEVFRILQEEAADDVEIATTPNQIIFKIGLTVISSRLIEGQFPAWEKIIPEKIVLRSLVEKHELLQAVKLASVFSKNEANIVTLKISKDSIILESSAKELGSQTNEIEGQTEGEAMEIAFNTKFLQDVLSACGSTQVMMEFSGPLSAAMVKPVGVEGLQYIIMPVRLN